ncbi:predicted protein [Histoplasma mississippiense (nom. inval.)]|uniref:predicted protein n=1 Tax=Ajellomyces capsulatus (strain NAm1 / WU24) TaxID=2059318 RepID=UPI000157C4C0|nr:predicted protein [Histoplasma mississippiense (nom. inval.)]EDN08507.1 predicted protein [Histoplasma mississippiense (nom. inval.)]
MSSTSFSILYLGQYSDFIQFRQMTLPNAKGSEAAEASYPWPDGRPQPWKRCRRKDIEIINRVYWSSGMAASYLSCGSASVQGETEATIERAVSKQILYS